MVRPHHIRQPRLLQYAHELTPRHFRYQKKRAYPTAFFGWHTRKLAQRQVTRRVEPKQHNVCDYQRPFTCFQFGKQQFAVRNYPHSPAFGVQHLAERGRARTFLVEDQDVHLLGLSLKTRRHSRSIGACTVQRCSPTRMATKTAPVPKGYCFESPIWGDLVWPSTICSTMSTFAGFPCVITGYAVIFRKISCAFTVIRALSA